MDSCHHKPVIQRPPRRRPSWVMHLVNTWWHFESMPLLTMSHWILSPLPQNGNIVAVIDHTRVKELNYFKRIVVQNISPPLCIFTFSFEGKEILQMYAVIQYSSFCSMINWLPSLGQERSSLTLLSLCLDENNSSQVPLRSSYLWDYGVKSHHKLHRSKMWWSQAFNTLVAMEKELDSGCWNRVSQCRFPL